MARRGPGGGADVDRETVKQMAARRIAVDLTIAGPGRVLLSEAGEAPGAERDAALAPIGSDKDRLNVAAISMAVAAGYDRVAASSTGKQAVSCAAYAAAAGVRIDAFAPDSAPELAAREISRYGGHPWITAWEKRGPAVRALVEHGWAYIGRNAPRPLANPYGLEGYKTTAYEIVPDLHGRTPTAVVMPKTVRHVDAPTQVRSWPPRIGLGIPCGWSHRRRCASCAQSRPSRTAACDPG